MEEAEQKLIQALDDAAHFQGDDKVRSHPMHTPATPPRATLRSARQLCCAGTQSLSLSLFLSREREKKILLHRYPAT